MTCLDWHRSILLLFGMLCLCGCNRSDHGTGALQGKVDDLSKRNSDLEAEVWRLGSDLQRIAETGNSAHGADTLQTCVEDLSNRIRDMEAEVSRLGFGLQRIAKSRNVAHGGGALQGKVDLSERIGDMEAEVSRLRSDLQKAAESGTTEAVVPKPPWPAVSRAGTITYADGKRRAFSRLWGAYPQRASLVKYEYVYRTDSQSLWFLLSTPDEAERIGLIPLNEIKGLFFPPDRQEGGWITTEVAQLNGRKKTVTTMEWPKFFVEWADESVIELVSGFDFRGGKIEFGPLSPNG